jgi:hypothetical protein
VVQEDSYKIYFVNFGHPTSFYEFWRFERISGIYLTKPEKEKDFNSARAKIWPVATVLGPAACHMWPAETAARPQPGG